MQSAGWMNELFDGFISIYQPLCARQEDTELDHRYQEGSGRDKFLSFRKRSNAVASTPTKTYSAT